MNRAILIAIILGISALTAPGCQPVDPVREGSVPDAPDAPSDAGPPDASGSDAGRGDAGSDAWLRDDLDDAPLGTLAASYLEANWPVATIGPGIAQGRVSVEGSDDRFLRVLCPEGELGASDSGATWRSTFPEAYEATAEYRVRFDPEFDWTEGGKLPGLTGGSSPTGGTPSPDGFSARYMWQSNGGLILYLYHSEMPTQYGQAFRLGTLQRGTWHTLKQRVRMNSPGQADGELQVWVDGELKLDRSDMRWRLEGYAWQIKSFYVSVFHGGNRDPYRPDRDNVIDFDDFDVVLADCLNGPSTPGRACR